MADKKISQLIPGTTLVGTEPIPMVQGGQTVATTPNAISALIKPYKVYTALLTQSGGDDPLSLSSGPVTKGVTYRISASSDGDFSNVGAPNNNENTWFVAINNEVPNSYGTDCQLFYNNAAPVVTVLENTIGNIWFTYDSVGYYSAISNETFTNNKTVISPLYSYDSNSLYFYQIGLSSPNSIQLHTNGEGDVSFTNYPIEIRVYS